ncbi:nuclear transport factor 2 family protein [Actinomadura latina]|uniref:Nuclear transport factor 2 family protein n=1 Tax=Actinomadura latina TaxID=163603 RepID=A0A846ZET4_9ACTN|nr:nuclear transport factor 2 family protein [Actinomadura latina]NKZ09193.1 nuclear transport factor 2 family protein [Actinomadura latina]
MDVTGWIDRLEAGWRNRDADAIAALFAEDARYRQGPFGDPRVGRAAIRAHWAATLGRQRDPLIWFGEPLVAGRRAALEWWCVLHDPSEGTPRTAAGCVTLWFGGDGLCRALHEYWHGEPGRAVPPYGGWPHGGRPHRG